MLQVEKEENQSLAAFLTSGEPQCLLPHTYISLWKKPGAQKVCLGTELCCCGDMGLRVKSARPLTLSKAFKLVFSTLMPCWIFSAANLDFGKGSQVHG